jgi:hypothetical protein
MSGQSTSAYFRNQITRIAAVPLAKYLRRDTCPLEFLDLSHNDLQDDGLYDLLSAITSHKNNSII